MPDHNFKRLCLFVGQNYNATLRFGTKIISGTQPEVGYLLTFNPPHLWHKASVICLLLSGCALSLPVQPLLYDSKLYVTTSLFLPGVAHWRGISEPFTLVLCSFVKDFVWNFLRPKRRSIFFRYPLYNTVQLANRTSLSVISCHKVTALPDELKSGQCIINII